MSIIQRSSTGLSPASKSISFVASWSQINWMPQLNNRRLTSVADYWSSPKMKRRDFWSLSLLRKAGGSFKFCCSNLSIFSSKLGVGGLSLTLTQSLPLQFSSLPDHLSSEGDLFCDGFAKTAPDNKSITVNIIIFIIIINFSTLLLWFINSRFNNQKKSYQ